MSQSPWQQKVGTPIYVALFGGLAFIAVVFFGLKGFMGFMEGKNTELSTARMYPMFAATRGLELYAADMDDMLPDSTAWMDVSLPYAAEELQVASRRDLFQTPDADSNNEYGIAMNSALSRIRVSAIKDPHYTVGVFSSTDFSWNASGGVEIVRYVEGETGAMVCSIGVPSISSLSPGENMIWKP